MGAGSPQKGGLLGFLREFVSRVGRSDIFFLAGGLAFNVLLAAVPLLLFVVGVSGYLLGRHLDVITGRVVELLVFFLPTQSVDLALTGRVRDLLGGIIEERAGFSALGVLGLLWISTRLVGSTRTVLRDVFEVGRDRGILMGKVFDLRVVLIGGVLVLLNVGATVALGALPALDPDFMGFGAGFFRLLPILAGQFLSFATAWFLFYLLYRYLTLRRIPFRAAALGATFTAVAYEGLKGAFAWYVTSLASYSNAYGSLAVVAVLFFWIYYSAVVFILGAHIARTCEVRSGGRMDKDRNEVKGSGAGAAGSAALLLLLALLPLDAAAQSIAPFGGNGKVPGYLNQVDGVVFASSTLDRNLSLDRPLVDHSGPYVVVHLAENRVLLLDGTEVVWSAPAGTGHGFQLEGQGQEWTFTTPIGMFHVLRKEKDPVWIAPDWYYVQRNLTIPSRPQDRARIPGTLGTSALFLGDGIAIHGTDQPELLFALNPDDRRVSHGCIRLTNEAARELFHRVDVGTPVLIF